MADGERQLGASAPGQPEALAELRRLLGFHISLANTTIKAHFQRNSAHLGLTQKQIAILWLIDRSPGIIQVELARHLRVKRATMSAMVGTLVARDLVARQTDDSIDARHVPFAITEQGKAVLREARSAIELHEQWVRGHFTDEEQRAIATLMTKLHGGSD